MGISQLKIVKLCTRTMNFSVIFVHFIDQSFLAVHQNMTHHIQIRLLYKRSEWISSRSAETATHVRVWCHFILLKKTVVWATRDHTRKTFVCHYKVVIKTYSNWIQKPCYIFYTHNNVEWYLILEIGQFLIPRFMNLVNSSSRCFEKVIFLIWLIYTSRYENAASTQSTRFSLLCLPWSLRPREAEERGPRNEVATQCGKLWCNVTHPRTEPRMLYRTCYVTW